MQAPVTGGGQRHTFLSVRTCVSKECHNECPRAVQGGRARRVPPRARSARLAGRHPSAPTPARLRPWLALLPRLPAPSRSLCRAARAAVEGLEEGLAQRAVEPPADALPTLATADVVAVVRGEGRTPPNTCEE